MSAECADGLCRALTGAPLRFEDASTGAVREYGNEPGASPPAVTDVRAFAGSCER